MLEVPGHEVRVIEYQVTDRHQPDADPQTCRLVTTLLDPGEAPATEPCGLYHHRWELESTFEEIKTSQRGSGIVLRSKSPRMVYQELYALLLTHYAVRELMLYAAQTDSADIELERLSYIRSLRLVCRHITAQAAFPPDHLEQALTEARRRSWTGPTRGDENGPTLEPSNDPGTTATP